MYGFHYTFDYDTISLLGLAASTILGLVVFATLQKVKHTKLKREDTARRRETALNLPSGDQSAYRNNSDQPRNSIDEYLSTIDFSTEDPSLVKALMGRLSNRSKQIYSDEISQSIKPEDYGKFIAIHIASHDFAIDSDHIKAAKILRDRNAKGQIYVQEICPPAKEQAKDLIPV